MRSGSSLRTDSVPLKQNLNLSFVDEPDVSDDL